MVAIAMKEAIGTVGILCPDEAPLLSFLSLVLPAIADGQCRGRRAKREICHPRRRALSGLRHQSDLPGGVVNIVAGRTAELAKTLAEHDDIDAIWSFRDQAASAMVKLGSIGNLKQVWTNEGRLVDWFDPAQSSGKWFLQHATQVKNIWVPYGE